MTDYFAYSGHPVSDTVVSGGSILNVENGGTATSNTLVAGGTEYVSSGGTASATTVSSGGLAYVLNSGTEIGAIVEEYGTETVSSGGTAISTTVNEFGDQYVYTGGVASGAILNEYGTEIIASGGTAVSTSVAEYAHQYVYAGGTASGATVGTFGYQNVSGGIADGTTLNDVGYQYIYSGGTASGTTVNGQGSYQTLSAGTAYGTTVNSGGWEYVFGGTASGTTVNGGGVVDVTGSGTVTSMVVNSGGSAFVDGGGSASNTTIAGGTFELYTSTGASDAIDFTGDGGELIFEDYDTAPENVISGFVPGDKVEFAYVSTNGTQPTVTVATAGIVTIDADGGPYNLNIAGATVGESSFQVGYTGGDNLVLTENATYDANPGEPVSNATVSGSQVLDVNVGGMAPSNTVISGGSEYVFSGGTAYGTTVSNGGYEYITSGGVESGGKIASGVLEIANGGGVSGGVTFTGSGGELMIDSTAMPTAVISGFAPGDSIKLAAVAYDSATDSVGVLSAGVVTVTADGATYDLNIAGAYVGETNFVIGDGLLLTEAALCFCLGTRIATPLGNITVESLKIGDLVQTLRHGAQPIKWIGRRAYAGRFIEGNHLALPVRIRRHAIAFNIPSRDLFVSPGHAICEGGVLIPAWRLINGVSITQAAHIESVEYFHIELENHAIIFAENCPVESYLDVSCRQLFHNAAEFYALYPEGLGSGSSCLPRLEGGFYLHRIQTQIARRAGVMQTVNTPGRLRGFVDQVGLDGAVSGWAQDEGQPEVPVCLDIVVDGRCVVHVLANRYRGDLREARIGSGCHGFELHLPAGLIGQVEVRRSVDGAELILPESARQRVA